MYLLSYLYTFQSFLSESEFYIYIIEIYQVSQDVVSSVTCQGLSMSTEYLQLNAGNNQERNLPCKERGGRGVLRPRGQRPLPPAALVLPDGAPCSGGAHVEVPEALRRGGGRGG